MVMSPAAASGAKPSRDKFIQLPPAIADRDRMLELGEEERADDLAGE